MSTSVTAPLWSASRPRSAASRGDSPYSRRRFHQHRCAKHCLTTTCSCLIPSPRWRTWAPEGAREETGASSAAPGHRASRRHEALAAVRGKLEGTNPQVFGQHFETHVADAICDGRGDEIVDELMETLACDKRVLRAVPPDRAVGRPPPLAADRGETTWTRATSRLTTPAPWPWARPDFVPRGRLLRTGARAWGRSAPAGEAGRLWGEGAP
jgi:hypothetical protein